MPENRDEFLAQLGFLALRGERAVGAQLLGDRLRDAAFQGRVQFLELVARVEQIALVAAPVGRVEHRQADELRLPRGVLAFGGVDQHRHALAVLPDDVERDLVEEALHPQQRREVGLVEDAARDVEQIVQPLAAQLLR